MKTKFIISLMVIALFIIPNINFAQAPPLGTASNFVLFTAGGAFGNVGASYVTGDIGTYVGAFTGFPPGTIVGQIHVADPVSAQAATDVDVAYSYMSGITCGAVIGTTLGNSQVLTPDVYCLGAASTLTGDLVLDGQGDPNALFIFKIDGALTTSTFTNVVLINSASLCNVYWQINGLFTLGDSSVFRGTIVGNGAINLLTGATLLGRGLTRAGAISTSANTVTMPSCCSTNNTWTNAIGDFNWTTANNWSLGHAPDVNSEVIIMTGTTLTITNVPDNIHIDKLLIMKNGNTGTNVTLKGSVDASVLILNGLMSCHDIAFEVEDKCELHCNLNTYRVNIILMPGANGLLKAPVTDIPADNAVFEPSIYYNNDAANSSNIKSWIDTTYNGNIVNYYKTKGLLLRANSSKHSEFIQEKYNDKKVIGWVEWYLPSQSVTLAYNNVHYTSIPVCTDLIDIPCGAATGDVLHEFNDLNNYGAPIKPIGYYVRKWDGALQNWSQRNDSPFLSGGWYGAFSSSCDAELNILHSGGAVNNPYLGNVEAGEGLEIFPKPSLLNNPSTIWYGPLNTFTANAPLTWNVSLPSSPNDHGWILVGNPFASAIKLGELSGTTTAGAGWVWPSTFDPGVWYWDASNQKYRYWNFLTHDTLNFPQGTQTTANFIGSSQAFFVYAYATPPGGTDVFQIDNGARQFQPSIQLTKSTLANNMTNTMHLYVSNTTQNLEMDEMAVHFINNASTNYIRNYDAFKMFRGGTTFSELYTVTNDNINVAIKNYPITDGTTIVPVYFQVGPSGNYELKANDLNSFPTNTTVQIIDKKLNLTQDLRSNNVYSFASIAGDNPYRFDILFADVPNGINKPTNTSIKVFSSGSIIYIVSDTIEAADGIVTVYDMIGKQLISKSLQKNTTTQINTNLDAGYYVVSVKTNKTVVNQKIYIN